MRVFPTLLSSRFEKIIKHITSTVFVVPISGPILGPMLGPILLFGVLSWGHWGLVLLTRQLLEHAVRGKSRGEVSEQEALETMAVNEACHCGHRDNRGGEIS